MSPRLKRVTHAFVELMPQQLESGVVYISVEYKTMVHLCCCGCGKKVVTPLSPTGWQLTYDGKSITISPSVGNWNLECQSHYWIEKSKVYWASQWPEWKIAAGFSRDQRIKRAYFGEDGDDMSSSPRAEPPPQPVENVDAGHTSDDVSAREESAAADPSKPRKKRRKRWWR